MTLESPLDRRRANQSILKEINLDYSLEGLMLKLKRQYFGHLMQRADWLEEPLMLGKIEGRRKKGQQRMRWLDGITDNWYEFEQTLGDMKDRDVWPTAVHQVANSQTWLSNWTTTSRAAIWIPVSFDIHTLQHCVLNNIIWCPESSIPQQVARQLLTVASSVGDSSSWLNICFRYFPPLKLGHPRWLSGKEPACQCRRCGLDPWVGKIPWRGKWLPTPAFLPGKSHGQKESGGLQSMGLQKSRIWLSN